MPKTINKCIQKTKCENILHKNILTRNFQIYVIDTTVCMCACTLCTYVCIHTSAWNNTKMPFKWQSNKSKSKELFSHILALLLQTYVPYADARSHCHRSVKGILATAKEEKKGKYCEWQLNRVCVHVMHHSFNWNSNLKINSNSTSTSRF